MVTKITLGLIALFLVFANIATGFYPDTSSLTSSILIRLPLFCVFYLWGMWFEYDRRRRHIGLPFDTGMLIYPLWPVAIPYYLLRTQGEKGIRSLLVVFAVVLFSVILGTFLSAILNNLLVEAN